MRRAGLCALLLVVLTGCPARKPPPPPTPPNGRLGYAAGVNALAYAPDGRRIAVALSDGTVHVHDMDADQELALIVAHPGGVTGLALLPDGKRLVTAGADGRACLWDVGSRQLLRTYDAQAGGVGALAAAADGSALAVLPPDGVVRVWDVENGRLRCTVPAGASSGLALSPDGRTLAVVAADAVTWHDATTGARLAAVPSLGFARGSAQSSAVYSADGKQLVVACGGFAVLDTQTRQAVAVVQTTPPSGKNWGFAAQVALSPKGQWLACRTTSGEVAVWPAPVQGQGAVTPRKFVRVLTGSCVALDPDEATLAVGCVDGRVLFFDLTTLPDWQGN
jgi:WD40 repeat protein